MHIDLLAERIWELLKTSAVPRNPYSNDGIYVISTSIIRRELELPGRYSIVIGMAMSLLEALGRIKIVERRNRKNHIPTKYYFIFQSS